MVPDGWKNQSLGDLLCLEYGDGLPQTERTGHGYAVYGSSGVIGEHSDYLIEGPGIIVGRKGTVGAIKWSQNNFWPIDTTYYVYPTEELGLRWLYWLLLHSRLDRLDASTGVPGLNRYEAYALSVLVPPLPEQRRIAEILDAADETIRQTERVIAKLREVKRGLLHDLLTRGLDADGNLRDPVAHPEQFKDSPLGWLPREWEVRQLKDLSFNKGDYGSGAAAREYSPNLPRYVRITDIRDDGTLDPDSIKSINRLEAKGYYLQKGDLLFARSGATVGKTYLYRESDGKCAHAGYVIKYSLDPSLCSPKFVFYWTQSEFYWSWVKSTLRQGAQPNVNAREYRESLLVYPPITEQHRIAAALDAHDARIRAEEAVLAKRRQVKRGLMADLLTGRVRVRS